jgi:crotonobetainyl-CoA:carnitine CoA-transferase CaiB-like acyl-CoA transferase
LSESKGASTSQANTSSAQTGQTHQGAAGTPLEGVRVLEFGTVVMAPYAGKVLVDMGADVVKIEPPGGDIGKRTGPIGRSLSTLTLSLNAGKRSIVLNAKDTEDREIVNDLIRWADVVVTNLLPRRQKAFGVDWESVRSVDDTTILVTGQGYAAESEHADKPSYDDLAQAASGVADTHRLRDGEPQFSPYLVADKVCGITMAQAALAALFQRTRTGRGQWVDVPMVDTMAAFTMLEHLGRQTLSPYDGEPGWPRVLEPEHRPLRAVDGWICVMPYTDSNWKDFCQLIDRPDYLDHPDLVTNAARSVNPGLYEQIVADYAGQRTVAQIEAECEPLRIPVQRVVRVDDLTTDPYLSQRPFIRHMDHSVEGEFVFVGSPLDFAGSDPVEPVECSLPDADRDEILAMLGREDSE